MSLMLFAGIAAFFAVLLQRIFTNDGNLVTMRIEKKNMAKEPSRTLTLTKENFDFGLYVAYVGKNTTIANKLENYFTYALNKIDYAMITDPVI